MTTLDLNRVNKTYGKVEVLSNVCLSVDKGDFIVVVGPSGCGKSSLLRMIAGLETVSSGQILINRRCVNDMPPAKRDIAMVFQNYALYPHMNVFDNMAYGLKMRRQEKSSIQKEVERVAGILQLSGLLQRKPSELSGGQRQRVAMGRAIVRHPAVFLFDEPLSNLDAKLRTEMRLEIKSLQRALNITSIYVTHDQTEAMTMADKIVVLNRGRVEQVASPDDIYHRPKTQFVAGFMGASMMNFIPANGNRKGDRIDVGMGFCLPAPSRLQAHQKLTIGIRPEHFISADAKESEKLRLKVESVEILGADKMVHGVCAETGCRLSVRVDYATRIDETSGLALTFDDDKVNIFDQITCERIGA